MKVGFFELLLLILVTLKLTGYIALSWWVITLPVTVPALVFLFVFLIFLL